MQALSLVRTLPSEQGKRLADKRIGKKNAIWKRIEVPRALQGGWCWRWWYTRNSIKVYERMRRTKSVSLKVLFGG